MHIFNSSIYDVNTLFLLGYLFSLQSCPVLRFLDLTKSCPIHFHPQLQVFFQEKLFKRRKNIKQLFWVRNHSSTTTIAKRINQVVGLVIHALLNKQLINHVTLVFATGSKQILFPFYGEPLEMGNKFAFQEIIKNCDNSLFTGSFSFRQIFEKNAHQMNDVKQSG